MKLKAFRILAQSPSHLFYQGFFLNEKEGKKRKKNLGLPMNTDLKSH